MGRVPPTVSLSASDGALLESWARKHSMGQARAMRARIVLLAAQGMANGDIAEAVNTSQATVSKWRTRFVENGIDGLSDEPRPGAPRSISDDRVQQIVNRTLEAAPPGMTHWSTRELAKRSGVSR